MQAKAGRCSNSLMGLQIDELSNYDRTCTIILISSFLSYKLTVITPVKRLSMTVSYPNTLNLLGARHTEKNRRVPCFFFVRSLFQKMRTQMKLLFSETSVALVFYCLGSRTRTMVSLNPVGSHSVCNFFIQNNDAQL